MWIVGLGEDRLLARFGVVTLAPLPFFKELEHDCVNERGWDEC